MNQYACSPGYGTYCYPELAASFINFLHYCSPSSGFYGAGKDNRGRCTDKPSECHPMWTVGAPTSITLPFFTSSALSVATLPWDRHQIMLACVPGIERIGGQLSLDKACLILLILAKFQTTIGCHDVRTYKDLWTFVNEKWINPYSKVVLLWFWNYCWQSVMVGFGGVSWVSVSVVSKLHVYTTVIQFNILLQNKISQQAYSIEL